MRDEIMGAQEEANRLHELRQGAVSELSRLRYAEEELEQVVDVTWRCDSVNSPAADYISNSLQRFGRGISCAQTYF